MDIQARIDALKAKNLGPSKEDQEELALRRQLAVEQERLVAELADARALEQSRAMDRARAELGEDATLRIVDVDADSKCLLDVAEGRAERGWYLLRDPKDDKACKAMLAKMRAGEQQDHETNVAMSNFVMDCIVDSHLGADWGEIRRTWDRFTLVPRSLLSVCLQLKGLALEVRERKS